ncbi:hypothetical protein R2APBS1_3646 [Rhodanobacter denitrificans]|uniref:Uncharacterized protein n=1 Tax=Rhodanobacter denitrificans TaxID=666685 RepID=M4NT90_9GAMM|nr:hypothetical protein R2APBS1_3646 [Rhodanobacter denitrificans]
MSPLSMPARTHLAPVFAGRAPLPAGGVNRPATTTTTTITTRSGWVSVRD